MYILYVDDSGSVQNPTDQHFVLAGIAVFERQIYHLINSVDQFVEDLGLGPAQDIELHANVVATGRDSPWRGNVPRKERLEIIEEGLDQLNRAHARVKAFAVVVDKQAVAPDDPVERAFEEICNRFNLLLTRIWNRDGEAQRGLVVMDETTHKNALQGLARRYRERGTRWGDLRNLAEVPMFVDSRASRIIQLADLLAWSVRRRYELGDTRYFDRIVGRFDTAGGVIHGLVHFTPPGTDCKCPACLSRALRSPNRG